ncbi:hypothetical protein Acid345_3824 [Candidatus Koribacter versatilis Ellin345]|uniref:Aminoglycoside phosphotransferase domain-containing protein n=1 Tax=Koribacter versatilis (strain Ellin345) TaxID=204669 RepID=Q1IJX6_KORVE|nr:phosphotransferase [Candidatus Koribacter versatilis]ABF42824.1 hypothetical protein Acid345_3824 [Candidatus Koribacter versatilis Ellin345]
MKIGELIRYEPFGERFEETTARFLKARFGGDWKVRWSPGRVGTVPGAQQWLVNYEINSVFHPTARANVFDVVRREFSSSPVRWKRPLQRMYFGASVSKVFAPGMAHARVDISPAVPDPQKWLIVPGTHKVRYIDTEERRVYCHLKHGSRMDRFAKEIEARRSASGAGVAVPGIVGELGEECVIEEMVVGTPLNRLSDAKLQQDCVLQAKSSMQPLYDATVCQEQQSEYAKRLSGEIAAAVAGTRIVASLRDTILSAVENIQDCLQDPSVVQTVQSHGDFQPANILWDGQRVWIIDWEYSGRRQRDYDALVYALQSRFARGIAARTRVYLKGIATRERAEAVARIRCFLLEEFAFRCEELTAATHEVIAPTFLELLEEAEEMLVVLSEEENAGKSKVSVFQTNGAVS